MHAHQLLSIGEAARDPNHQQDRVSEQQQLRERQQTIGTSRKMAKRGHDGRVSRDADVVGRGIAGAEKEVILSLLWHIVVHVDFLLHSTMFQLVGKMYTKESCLYKNESVLFPLKINRLGKEQRCSASAFRSQQM